MTNRDKRINRLVLLTPILLTTLTAELAHADIFKWKDKHGVTQYSDSPPVSGFIKATRNEVVNALQKKDLCAEPLAKKLVNFTSKESANFFNTSFKNTTGRSTLSGANTSLLSSGSRKTNTLSTSNLTRNSTLLAASSKTTSNVAYNPFKQSTALSFGNQKVSVFSGFFKPKTNTTFSPSTSQTLVATAGSSTPVLPTSSTPTLPVSTTSSALPVTNTAPVLVAALPTSSGVVIPSSKAPTVSTDPVQTAPVASPPLAVTPTTSSPVPVATLPTTSEPTTTTPANTGTIQRDMMPAVNLALNMTPSAGWTDLRIRPVMGSFDIPPVGDGDGQFRIDCTVSHMSNDDPLVYPNQQGAAHHHTFFGNTSINYKSNLATLSTTGNSTCRGGIANRSAYWVPSMIDSESDTPIKPYSSLWYYKTGYSIPKEKITAPPKGLRIVTGNMKATSAATSRNISFTCFKEGNDSPPATTYIPSCPQTWTIVTHVGFPQCWDGKNLDSPDHISHMANPIGSSCPVSHPVAIPSLGLNVKYLITDPEGTKNWRLSSDNYAKNGYNSGYSSHADWVNGWDENVIAGVVRNCLNAGKDCGNHMLGDGTVIFADNVGVR